MEILLRSTVICLIAVIVIISMQLTAPLSNDNKSAHMKLLVETALISVVRFFNYCSYSLFAYFMQNTFAALDTLLMMKTLAIAAGEIWILIYSSRRRKEGMAPDKISYRDMPDKLYYLLPELAGKKEKKASTGREPLSNIKLCALPVFLLVFIYAAVGVLELYFSNLSEWKFTVPDIVIPTLAVSAGLFLLLMTAAAFIPREAAEKLAVYVTVFCIMSFFQNSFMNVNTFIDGTSEMLTETQVILNTLIWGVPFAAAWAVCRKRRSSIAKISAAASGALLFIQAAPLPFLLIEGIPAAPVSEHTDYCLDGTEQFELSSDGNILVLFFDTFYSRDMRDYLEAVPEREKKLSDFIMFDNVSTETFYTAFSMPYILTGQDIDFSIPLKTSNKNAWNSASAEQFYSSMHDNGYEVRYYTSSDNYSGGAENMLGKIDNVKMYSAKYTAQRFPTYFSMMKLSLYRYLPFGMKDYFIVSESAWINRFVKSDYIRDNLDTEDWNGFAEASILQGISYLNSDYYNGLKEGITLTEGKKLCVFQHLHGMHEPYNSLKEASTFDDAINCCFDIMEEVVSNLKELGIYDSTTIIFTADHGIHRMTNSSPAMLIKPAGHTADKLAVNTAPGVIQKDLLPTVLDCAGIPHDTLGMSLFDIDENMERERISREFDRNLSFPPAGKCEAAGVSVYNCYYEYSYVGRIDDPDVVLNENGTYPITDYWW